MSELFRSEAMRFQAARLQGEVMLAIRFRWGVLGIFCAALVALVVAAACLSTYSVKEQVAGTVVAKGGIARLNSDVAGVVLKVPVVDGERVVAGQTLLEMGGAAEQFPCIGSNRMPTATVVWKKLADNHCAIVAAAPLLVAAVPVTPGEAVAAGSNLMALITDVGQLEIELAIPDSAVGMVKAGQEVALRFDALSYRKFGSLNGKVIAVATLPIGERDHLTYKARVSLPQNAMRAYGDMVQLRPGMTLKAVIVLDRQSLAEWLFDSFYAIRNPA